MTHRGNLWEAELAVLALEEGTKKLSETHQRLFNELNLTKEHFERLLERVTDKDDAERMFHHPNGGLELRKALEARYGPFSS